ncbi:MAG: SAM-dependent methyltransferase [Halobacteriovorax sp.]|nr:SAM-dependent methyltransferase [Halobacteriovorax sp.]|tara:strand:+ start:124184 stop:124894 length:711 start_codon:yes stop_codon:yes gene_type:complete
MINFNEDSFKDRFKIKLKNSLGYWFTKSFSQEGEDLILNRIYEHKSDGFFVDVGAHHPMRYSNTYLFYKKGWKGINVDAAPHSMDAFKELRPRDINIEVPVSDTTEELSYFMFNDGALNTLDEKRAKSIETESNGRFKIVKEVKLKTKTLEEILDQNIPNGKKIDFMSIDVEGLDLKVLKSNNWNKYSPDYLLVEDPEVSIEGILKSEISLYLNSLNYQLSYKTYGTCFYKLNKEN